MKDLSRALAICGVLVASALGCAVQPAGGEGTPEGRLEPTSQASAAAVSGLCTNATFSASPTSPQAAGTAVTVTGRALTCTTPEYEFWMQSPWRRLRKLVQSYSQSALLTTPNAYAWDTTTAVTGIYNLEVWVKDSTSTTTTYDTWKRA